MNCRDFLVEFEERSALSKTAALHLKDCADCRQITGVQTRVWQAMDAFEPIGAPNDFDFRVKARIAGAKSSDFKPHFLPVLRYVLPLGLVIMISAFAVVRGIYFVDDKTVPQVAKNIDKMPVQTKESANLAAVEQFAAANVAQPSGAESPAANNLTAQPAQINNRKESKAAGELETQFVAGKSLKKQVETETIAEKNFNGSRDRAVSPPRIFTPRGIPATPTIENHSDFDTVNSITTEQVLSQLGIESVLEKGRRQVKKITPNSVAERSGVKAGDVIEAIDGEALTGEATRAKTIEGKKLTIVRGAEKIEISLRN